MECPFELPVEKAQMPKNTKGIKLYRIDKVYFPYTGDEADYIVQAINSHEKLVDLANDLEHGLKYLRQTKEEPYGFGIDRLEEKLQALKELEKQ